MSNADGQLLSDVIYESWNSERGDDIPWIPEVGRLKLAKAILAAGFPRASQPVQVEVTDEMVVRATVSYRGGHDFPLADVSKMRDAIETALRPV